MEDGTIRGTLTPTNQNISFNRENPVTPTLTSIIARRTMGIVEYVEWYIQFENTSVEWLHSGGQTYGYMDFTSSGTLPLQVRNLDQLTGTNYKATIYITMSNSNDPFLTLTTTVNLTMSGIAANAIQTDKTNYTVVYRRNQNQLSGETHVNILNNNSGSNLNLETIGSLFKELTFTSGFDLVEDPNFPFSTNTELPTTGVTVVPCRIKKDGQSIYSFTTKVVVIDTEDIVVSPGNFDFLLRKGFNEIKQGTLMITNPLNKQFFITAPWWISLSINGTNSSVDLGFSTVNSENIDSGNYSGIIRITYDAKTIDIPVTMQVVQFVGIIQNDYNFCLDKVMLWTNQMFTNGVFARIKLKMQFEIEEGASEFTSTYSIPFFQGKATTDIGQKVQNYFPVYAKHLFNFAQGFNNKLVYRPASVFVTIEELDVNYNVLHSTSLDVVQLFAGSRPKYFPFLTNFGVRRYYPEFAHIFSFYTGGVIPDHFVINQNTNPISENDVQTVLVTDKNAINFDFLIGEGLDFIPMPKVEKNIVLQWLNQNLVPECMIFSGSYIIQDDFEHTADNFQINGKKYDSKEVSKITIKTGFILKEERLLLRELSKSKVSFMKIGDDIYNCFCTTSKLIRDDSEENLIQREMEFFIVL